jgi:hypothetical protein
VGRGPPRYQPSMAPIAFSMRSSIGAFLPLVEVRFCTGLVDDPAEAFGGFPGVPAIRAGGLVADAAAAFQGGLDAGVCAVL